MKKGDSFSYTFSLTETIYNGFIAIFNDMNPLHTDCQFAQNHGFSDKVMHGNILNGFLSYFIGEKLPIKNVIIQTQEIKYYKPVYLHDSLQFRAVIEDVFESVKTIELKFVFENQNQVKVARGKVQ